MRRGMFQSIFKGAKEFALEARDPRKSAYAIAPNPDIMRPPTKTQNLYPNSSLLPVDHQMNTDIILNDSTLTTKLIKILAMK
mmetsp:Transcript_21739/g.22635  ORF Transcript_21739/g.22635 Transcript_21739/m.22635 type:complete len:82 (-) Transcript_21739:262-507(-)